MTPQPNISKSVARAFAVLEMFRDQREPLTAAQLRRSLDMPQPSARALLKNLVELGYLKFDAEHKTYFPTLQIAALGDWIGHSVLGGTDYSRLVEEITLETGETTSLATVNGLNVEIVHVRTAAHPLALRLRPGVGESLWLTAAGRMLLGMFDAADTDAMLKAMIRQERNPQFRQRISRLPAELERIRRDGYFVGYDTFFEGIGAVCVGTVIAGQPAAVVVAGVRDRIRSNEQSILNTIRMRMKRYTL